MTIYKQLNYMFGYSRSPKLVTLVLQLDEVVNKANISDRLRQRLLIGLGAARSMVAQRKYNGVLTSLHNLAKEVRNEGLRNAMILRRIKESLVPEMSGDFDSLPMDIRRVIASQSRVDGPSFGPSNALEEGRVPARKALVF